MNKLYNLLMLSLVAFVGYFLYNLFSGNVVKTVVETGEEIVEAGEEISAVDVGGTVVDIIIGKSKDDVLDIPIREKSDNKIINFLENFDVTMHRAADAILNLFPWNK